MFLISTVFSAGLNVLESISGGPWAWWPNKFRECWNKQLRVFVLPDSVGLSYGDVHIDFSSQAFTTRGFLLIPL